MYKPPQDIITELLKEDIGVDINKPPITVNLKQRMSIWKINFKKINSNLFFDCTDNLKTSFELNQEMVNLNKPICFASASEFNGQIIIFKNLISRSLIFKC